MDFEGSGYGLLQVLSQNLPVRTEQNCEKPSVQMGGVLAEIQTKYICSTSLD
jgi:hypothetical protein